MRCLIHKGNNIYLQPCQNVEMPLAEVTGIALSHGRERPAQGQPPDRATCCIVAEVVRGLSRADCAC